jgi:hypothetical protein
VPPTAPARFGGLDYTFTLDAEIKTLAARACMRGAAPAMFVAGDADSARYMTGARLVRSGGSRAVSAARGVIDLSGAPADACLEYEIDLAAASSGERWWLADRSGPSVIASIVLFLWRPRVPAAELAGTARFVLPPGMQLSLAWPKQGDHYRLDPSMFLFDGHVVFGRFDEQQVVVPGGTLEVALLDGVPQHMRPWISAWLRSAGSAAAQQIGRFPVPRAQIIIVPVFRPGLTFGFADTGRSGGVSIAFFMPVDTSEQTLRDDWVAVHEFCHLLIPYVDRSDAWLSEGMATYLQEVVRARAGMIIATQAWQSIYEGALFCRNAADTLANETRDMPALHNYKRVYWAGAIMVLMADVELRKRTHGRTSLADVLARLTADPSEVLRYYRGADLLARMDALAGEPVFTEIAKRYLDAPKFPDLDALYPQLGVVVHGGQVHLVPKAPLSWVRDAIMTPGPSVLAGRGG